MINTDLLHSSFLIFFFSTIIVKITLLILNIKHVRLHYQQVPAQFQDIIKLDDHQKAQNYTIAKDKFSIFGTVLSGIVLLLWLETGLLNSLSQYIITLSQSATMQGVLLIFAFSVINSIVGLPESLYSTFVLEEKFGFNKMTPVIFIKDLIKNFAVSSIIGLPFVYLVLKILYTVGSSWWIYTWIFIITFQFLMIWAYPKFIAPLFNKFSKLEDEALIGEVTKLSKRCDINFTDYYIMNASIRSSHGNAYFTGFGKNKRIVFFDTLLSSLTTNEVVSVLAHELGHLKKKHIMKSIVISSLFLLLGLFVLGQLYTSPALFEAFHIQAYEGYISLLLFVLIAPFYTYLLTPIFSWSSRKNEFEADEFAATHASAKELISALLKMYKDNSSTLTPHPVYSKFYFSHPPAKERVDFLNSFDS